MSAPTALSKAVLKLPLALSGGDTATLADYAGAWVVLYFYPKDSTPGKPPTGWCMTASQASPFPSRSASC